jgi:tetratricopeptide (TPR) repeat protein
LKVISHSSAFAFKGKEIDPREAARRLGVEAVLEGSVQRSGDRARVDVRLVSARDGRVLWAGEALDHDLKDIFTLQDEITRNVAASLRPASREKQSAAAAKRYTDSAEAYQAYLRGRFHWYRRSIPDLNKAIEHFKQATRIDPRYALPYAGLAETYAVMESNAAVPPGTAAPLAREYARKAIELDGALASAYAALGLVKSCEWKWEEGEQLFREALSHDPTYSPALHWRAANLLTMCRFKEAEAELKHAQELDPLSLPIAISLWETYYYSRQTDRCFDQAETLIELFPDHKGMYWRLALSYMQRGLYDEALNALSKSNDDGWVLAVVLAFSGHRDEARGLIEEMAASWKGRNDPFLIAALYSALGESETAFSWLEKAHASRQANLCSLKVEPVFDPLRSDPRFQEMLSRLGLAD